MQSGVCRHDFMKLCVGRVRVGHDQGQGESFNVIYIYIEREREGEREI